MGTAGTTPGGSSRWVSSCRANASAKASNVGARTSARCAGSGKIHSNTGSSRNASVRIRLTSTRSAEPARRAGRVWSMVDMVAPGDRSGRDAGGGSGREPVDAEDAGVDVEHLRSEERRVGNEGVSTCRSWLSLYHSKKTLINSNHY